MQKLILGCVFSIISVAITSTVSVISVNAQPVDEYIDSSSLQAVETISGNIVAFRNRQGQSNNYYVPDWMFNEYNLKVGSTVYLYNRNVIQGIYRSVDREDGGAYIENVNSDFNFRSFALHDTRRFCTNTESPASEGLASGRRVWYKSVCCPSTIPVVGAMWFYQKRDIVAFQPSDRVLPTPAPYVAPAVIEQPVPALW